MAFCSWIYLEIILTCGEICYNTPEICDGSHSRLQYYNILCNILLFFTDVKDDNIQLKFFDCFFSLLKA